MYVGILFEEATNGSQFGPTNQCINADQFIALKKGDKYFYTNKGIFTNRQLSEIKKAGLAKVMCTQLEKSVKTTMNPFIKAKRTFKGVYNRILSCEEIGGFDFSAWKEEKQEKPVDVQNADCHTDPQTVFPVQNAKWSCSSGPVLKLQ